MRIQKQAFRHDPANGVQGDCHRTCLAMLLDLDKEEVPNYAEQAPDDGKLFTALFEDWLNGRGYASVYMAYSASLEDVLSTMRYTNPGIFYILGGTSKIGSGHSVVCLNDKIIADPSLDDTGIVAPMSDGHYWITLFTSIRLKANALTPEADPAYKGLADEGPEPCPSCGEQNPDRRCIGCKHQFPKSQA